MLATVVHALLGAVLVAAAVAKLARPAATRAALATHGLRSPRARAGAWAATIVAEAGLGVAVALGSDVAAWAAAALMAAFALLLVRALAAGRAGQPCGCLGPRSRVSRAGVARAALLALAFAMAPLVPATDPSATAWLAAGVALTAATTIALAVAVVALAREVGELRMALPPHQALEIPGEGPPLGSRVALIDRFALAERTRLAVALFVSEGCALCQALRPAFDVVADDPLLAVARFDEHADADVWQALAIPGSPYALVLAPDGTVLAQGTFNSLGQLQSLLATAERRAADALEVAHA